MGYVFCFLLGWALALITVAVYSYMVRLNPYVHGAFFEKGGLQRKIPQDSKGLNMFEYHKFKPTPLLSPAERKRIELEDLRDKIDLALALGDSNCNKQWFMELTEKLKEYEV